MKDSDLSATAARDAARIVWFKRYPAEQTLVAFLLALLATTAFSIDPAPVSSNAVLAIDPKATGALYVCYEVLLSFAGHTDAVMLLALACLLTLPFRYVFFGRGDAWRPSVVLPSLFFAVCMVFGRSYDLTDSAEIVLGDKARVICAWIGGAGWMLLAIVAFYLAFEFLDWLSSRRIPFSEAHFGRVWRVAHAVLSVHPFVGPFLVLMIVWAPTLIASLPGLFMGDTGATFLGYILATLSVTGLFKMYAIISFAVPFLILGVPIFDICFAFLRRIAKGQNPMKADRGHVHHRLIDMGFSQKQAVAISYMLAGILGLAAVLLTSSGELKALILIGAIFVVGAIGMRAIFGAKEPTQEQKSEQPNQPEDASSASQEEKHAEN